MTHKTIKKLRQQFDNLNRAAGDMIQESEQLTKLAAHKGDITRTCKHSKRDANFNILIGETMKRETEMIIYWDNQETGNAGPAYRDNGDSGALEFVAWSNKQENPGYSVHDFFDGDGRYLGADQHGIEPIFEK